MSFTHILWSWIIEPMVLVILITILVKMVTTNSRKIDGFTQEMCITTVKAQAFLQHVDREFSIMNSCAKSVKSVFLNFGKVYKEISEGSKTVEEAILEAKTSLPEELKRNLSNLFSIPVDESSYSEGPDGKDHCGNADSSVDLGFIKDLNISKLVERKPIADSDSVNIPKVKDKSLISERNFKCRL